MKNVVLLTLLGGLAAAPGHYASAQQAVPADKLLTSPPATAAPLPVAVSQPALAQYLGTVPAQIQKTAKARNVVFMNDCLTALTGHVKQFSEAGQRSGLTLAQIQDNNVAFVQKVVADLRSAYDKEEEEEHKNDPKNPRTGKSLREEAEIYTCGLRNYLPLFNSLMAAQPVVTILTQPTAANVFVAQAGSYRSLGVSQLSKPMRAGLYTLVFTKPGYQSVRRTLATQRMPVQVFRISLPQAVAAK